MADDVQPGTLLVIGVHDIPGYLFDVGVSEHFVLGPGVLHPLPAGLQVHGTQFPALGGILDPLLKTALLLLIAHRKPILVEDDSGTR